MAVDVELASLLISSWNPSTELLAWAGCSGTGDLQLSTFGIKLRRGSSEVLRVGKLASNTFFSSLDERVHGLQWFRA
jgi:hypothetical protein